MSSRFPALSPSTMASASPSSYEESDNPFDNEDMVWLMMWALAGTFFVALPFLTSKRRRQLCLQGIRERRFINDDEENRSVRPERRQQQSEETQHQFRTNKTQEDEIRHQYLSFLTKNYTITLTESDICDDANKNSDNTAMLNDEKKSTKKEEQRECKMDLKRKASVSWNPQSNAILERVLGGCIDNQCDTTFISSDIGSSRDSTIDSSDDGVSDIETPVPIREKRSDTVDTYDIKKLVPIREKRADTIDTIDNNRLTDIETPAPIREKRANSEDSDDLLSFDFENTQIVSVPLPGQAVEKGEEQTELNKRRLVSNGCAICLSHFEAGEEITWSSNPNCSHVFHKDCIINWYLAVGRKAQRRRKRENPDMTDEEALSKLCEFPINCPCCRQQFCTNSSSPCEKCEETGENTDGNNDGDDIETGESSDDNNDGHEESTGESTYGINDGDDMV